ncbi:MAG TPA: flagellar FliJ family protein [Terriglobales bacterium]|nr:flagellar FliJ family protein [Terriglobales bacterium]
MPFHFPLAAVLKFRESLERREYLALVRIQHEIMAIEAQLRQIEEWRLAAVQRREADLAKGVASVYLQDEFHREFALEQRRDALKVKLEETKLRHTAHLKSYQEARQKREVIDELRQRGLEAYTRQQAKRQQAVMDDLFLSRRRRDG